MKEKLRLDGQLRLERLAPTNCTFAESLSQHNKHVFRNESNPTVKLSDVIEFLEDPSLKPKLSKKYMNLSLREIHVMIIEALLK